MEQKLVQQQTPATWTIDPMHSGAEFVVRHLMIMNVRGSVPIKSATVKIRGDDFATATVEAELDVTKIHTGTPDRDGHLRSADFFDVENHPAMTFKSTNIKQTGDDEYQMTGNLTIRNTTREVVLAVEKTGETVDPWGNQRVGLEAKTTINRSEFELGWNQALETGGVVVSDKVKVELSLAFLRQK